MYVCYSLMHALISLVLRDVFPKRVHGASFQFLPLLDFVLSAAARVVSSGSCLACLPRCDYQRAKMESTSKPESERDKARRAVDSLYSTAPEQTVSSGLDAPVSHIATPQPSPRIQ